ncbi:LuxR C-terminal-related transcriptional regulator [Cryobacterium cryoconiti]|uniref:HTH luxR-type domain-containing protein n=1 Tax=Cryobacterium cryoconiti TaxID=1259239 RepID=A0A4Y8JYG1_9MICO|nr:LuxR C-terminal-related transcriptional regulator [Cryobacterium cryoconiti]TFD27896.1 hypothetical protein E3T49_12525 [Cryobacterium cryoconiti]
MTVHRVPASFAPGTTRVFGTQPFGTQPLGIESQIPAPAPTEVDRPRLDGAFHRLCAGEVRCVGVWAPAGAGKTTLVAAWARRLRRAGESVTWLRAPDPADLRPADVWQRAEQGAPTPSVSGDGGNAYVFVDDFGLRSAEQPGLLGEWVASVQDGTRVVVAGRSRPGAGMTPLRACGAMVDLAPGQLAFDRRELLALAAGHRMVLTQQEADILMHRTAGWATGLAVIVPSLGVGADSARRIRGFDGDDPGVAGFLREEIVAGWTDTDRDTVLGAAVRDLVTVDLAVHVTHRTDAGAVLDRLAGQGALITREDTVGYRIHPILLAYLQAEARRHDAGAAAGAHERASRWFARRGEGGDALEQALESRLPRLIAEMLDTFGLDLVLRGTPDLVVRALEGQAALAEGEAEPAASTLRLLLEAPYFPDRAQARHLLTGLESVRPGSPAWPSGNRAQTWTAVIAALTAFRADSDDEIRTGLSALRAARDGPGCLPHLGVDLLVTTAEAWCHAGLGAAEQAETGLREVAVSARNAGYQWLFLLAGDLGATSAARRGDWRRAGRIDEQVARATAASTRLMMGAGAAEPGEPFDRAAARAWVSHQQRRYERCDPLDTSMLARIVAADPLMADHGLIVPAQALLTLAEMEEGPRPRSALESMNGLLREAADAQPRVLSLCCLPWFDLTCLLDGRTEAARVAMLVDTVLGTDSLEAVLLRSLANPPARDDRGGGSRLAAAATPAGRCWRGSTLVSAWIVLAGIAAERDRPAEADARLVRALRLAERLRVERAFLGVGRLGVALLEARIGRLGDLDGFARRILSRSAPAPGTSHPGHTAMRTVGHTQVLTERERELLRELPFHQTIADIARKHSVSANTVKTHLRNIYRKLEATDRARACAIAQERGLL